MQKLRVIQKTRPKPKSPENFGQMRIFFIESVSPIEFIEETSEAESLKLISEQIGHEVGLLRAFSDEDFEKACEYISSIPDFGSYNEKEKKSLCIHISTHGCETGLAFGKDHLSWQDIFEKMKPIFEMNYNGPLILTISSCLANRQKIHQNLSSAARTIEGFSPPKYIFLTVDEVSWSNALVGWTVLYHQLPFLNLEDKDKIQEIFNSLERLNLGKLCYYRWDRKEYKKFTSKA